MTDVLTRKQRSYCMSRIRGRNTRPELVARKLMRSMRLKGFRRGDKIDGKPDFIFPKKRVAVFLDGCFWHKCPRCFTKPATRTAFWMNKISGNVKRDRQINRKLRKNGWRVLRFWEHEIKKNPERVVLKIRKWTG